MSAAGNTEQKGALGGAPSEGAITPTNAFRILGLEISAPLSAIVARANELQTLIKVNRVPAYPSDLPIFSSPDRSPESIAAAAHRLEGPATRLREEAAWFQNRTPIDMAALSALREQKTAQAVSLWGRSCNQASRPEDCLHYQHNLAVLQLCLAEMGTNPADSTAKFWKDVFSCWAPVLESDDFWRSLVAASPARSDPRCHPGMASEIRDLVGSQLAYAAGFRAMRSVYAEEYQAAGDWFTLLNHGQFPDRFLSAAKEGVAGSLVESIRTHSNEIEAQLRAGHQLIQTQKEGGLSSSGEPTAAASVSLQAIDAALESKLSTIVTLCDMLIALTSTSHPAVLGVMDSLAEAHQFIGVYFGKRQALEKSRQITEAALRFAVSDAVRAAVQRNLRIASWNVVFPQLCNAIEAKDSLRAEAAYKELEGLVDTEDEAKMVESYRETLSFLRLLRDGSPINKVPSLYRMNGIGTWLFGKTNVDAATGTYVSSLYFTFVFIPLFVIRRYRVRDAGSDSYNFYAKLALTTGQKAWNAAVGLAIAIVFIANMGSERPKSTASYTPPSAPTSSSATSSARTSLAAEIGRRRPFIESEKVWVDTESSAIDRAEAELKSLKASIEGRRSIYPSGLPPAEYAQDQAEVELYNRKLGTLKTRVSQFERRVAALDKSIDEFNSLVRDHNASR